MFNKMNKETKSKQKVIVDLIKYLKESKRQNKNKDKIIKI